LQVKKKERNFEVEMERREQKDKVVVVPQSRSTRGAEPQQMQVDSQASSSREATDASAGGQVLESSSSSRLPGSRPPLLKCDEQQLK
jgi:hypothetical protein